MKQSDQLAPNGVAPGCRPGPVSSHRWWAIAVFVGVLILGLFWIYWPVLHAPFLWDDDAHLTAHKCIVGPLGFREIWTSAEANYFPLVLTHFWVLHAFFGFEPAVYHVTTIILHVGAALALWGLLAQLRVPGGWLAAALWALHPVQVESVAWISEFTNTQSGLFFFLGLWCGVKWLEAGARAWLYHGLALACALAAMLSKPSTVMFPVALGLCAWWRYGRLSWRTIGGLVPFFAVSLVTSAWAIWEQKFHSGALGADWNQSLPERLVIAGRVVWFYLGKLLWPDPLTFIYPRWATEITPVRMLPLLALAAAAVLLIWGRKARGRSWFVAGAFFVALLFPVLGLFNVFYFRYSFVADHFVYLASAGPLALLGAWLAAEHSSPVVRSTLRVGGCAVLLAFAVRGRAHVHDFADSESLWRSTLRDNPECVLALSNLAAARLADGHIDEARAYAEKAVAARPVYGEPYFNLAKVYDALPGERSRAIENFRTALTYSPKLVAAYAGLGDTLMAQGGNRDEAVRAYEHALELDPKDAKVHSNLAIALGAFRDRLPDAIRHAEEAVRLDPKSAEAQLNRGLVLNRTADGRGEAINACRAAIQLRPDYAKAHLNLGMLLLADVATQGEGVAELETAVRLEPKNAIAHNNLAVALAQTGDVRRAIFEVREALRLDPDYVDARNNLATLAGQASPEPASRPVRP